MESSQPASLLSERAKRFSSDMEYMSNYSMVHALQNSFDETKNPEGIVNFGTAVNGMMDDVWLQRFSEKQFFTPDPTHYRYYQFWGVDSLREALAKFMNAFFNPAKSILFNNIRQKLYVLNGALLSLDILSLLLADEGESFIYLTPGYSGYLRAGVQRWGIRMVPVPLQHNAKSGELFELTMATVEKVISDEESNGRRIRAFVLNNPQNPLGKVYSIEMVQEIMKICQRRRIHLIADEMYCMSVFDGSTNFHSVLEIHRPELLDVNMLHVIWGFSKDLCLTSFRTGVIHTENIELQNALKSGSQFQAVSLPTMHILKNVISDIDWFKNQFVPTNHSRLKKSYEKCKQFFEEIGFRTTRCSAGFFILVDFSPLFRPPCEVSLKEFIRKLYAHKVYLTPSWDISAPIGWFRFVFTGYAENGINIGLARLRVAIEEWKSENCN